MERPFLILKYDKYKGTSNLGDAFVKNVKKGCMNMEERTVEKTTDYFNVADIFGENVFNDAVMQERLPKKSLQEIKRSY